MYRQRPAYPALLAALFVLIMGAFICYALNVRVEEGSGNPVHVVFCGCFSLGLACVLTVVAYARYQFTALWKHPDPALSSREHHRHHRHRRSQRAH